MIDYSARGAQPLDTLWRDVRHAVRRLARDWPFAASAVVILATGIGANTAIFSVVNTALFRPQSFSQTDQLVNVYQNVGPRRVPSAASFPAYRDIAQQADVFSDVGAFLSNEARYQAPDRIRPAIVEYASSGYLSTLGLQPARGRWFNAQEDGTAAAPVAVVGYRTWTDRYGADPAIVGLTVRVNGAPVTIVGVAPPTLHNSMTAGVFTDFWLSISATAPTAASARTNLLERRDDPSFQVRARLREGVTPQQAQAAMDVLAARLRADYPDTDPGQGMTVLSARDVRFGPQVDAVLAPASAVLLGIVGLVLAIACSNLATLLLVRGSARAKEISVRLALGATRWQLVRHLLAESLLLATAGAAGGWLLAGWSMRFLSTLDIGIGIDLGLDYRVLGYAAGLSLLTGIGSGLAPALASTKVGLAPALREQGGTVSTARGRFTLKNALIVAQVAASFVLLMITGFAIRTVTSAAGHDPGFPVGGLAILETDTRFAGYDRPRTRAMMEELVRRIQATPGVEGAFSTNGIPPNDQFDRALEIDGYQPQPGEEGTDTSGGWASPGFFETLQIPVLYGRTFTDGDRPGTPEVAVVNETMARLYFGSPNAVGRRFRYAGRNGGEVEIIGVVGDTREPDDFEGVRPAFYLSGPQAGNAPSTIVARTSREDTGLARLMQDELRKLDPALPVLTSATMQGYRDDALRAWNGGVAVLSALAVLGLGLACLGLYAVVAFAVTRRAHEVGIRMALGAQRPQVVWLVMRDVTSLIWTGMFAGLGVSLMVLTALGAFTPSPANVELVAPATDPMTFVSVGLVMACVGLLAAFFPARRAAHADPLAVLRSL